MQQSPKSSKPTQQTPNPRPVSKRDKATHHLPLSLLSRQRGISAIKAERKRSVYGRYLQEEDAYISNIQKAILEFVGQHWNDNKYLHRNLRENRSHLAEAERRLGPSRSTLRDAKERLAAVILGAGRNSPDN